MSNSTVVEWLNENGLRAYPLLETSPRYAVVGQVSLDLYSVILDAALFYEAVPTHVTINTITTNSGNLVITVAGQPPFTVSSYTSASYPQYVRNSNHSLLVVGDASTIPTNLTFNLSGTEFEPSTAIEIYPATKGVSSINLTSNVLTGNVVLSDGYQLTFQLGNHVINIEVGRNEGHPLPCASFTNITNDCSTVASFVNGAAPVKTGDTIKLVAGQHIKIFQDTDNNRVYIGFDFVESDVSRQILQPPTKLV